MVTAHYGIKVPIINQKEIAQGTVEIRFPRNSGKFHFSAGQYMHVTVPLQYQDPRGNGRDFSIASSPTDPFLAIAVRGSGSGFKRSILTSKDIVFIRGPYGKFTLPVKTHVPLVFIAGGIGITPFFSMIRFVLRKKLPYRITLLYFNKNPQSAAYLPALSRIAKRLPDFTLKAHIGQVSKESISTLLSDFTTPLFYIAGPPLMVASAKECLTELSVPRQKVKEEEFTGYQDPFGIRKKPDMKTESIMQRMRQKKLGAGIEGELSQRSLSDLEALLQALNNTAIVSETNSQGTITFVNDKFVEISKYPKEELLGQNHRILKSGYHSKAFYENLWATITRGKLWRGQIKNKAKDGSFYWVDTSIAPIIGPDNLPEKYISVRFPITERQLAEEELKERAKQQSVLTLLSQEALASINLHDLFDKAVTLLSQTLSLDYCAVLKLLPGGKHFIYESGTGFTIDMHQQIYVSAETSSSMAGYTFYSKIPVIIEDLSTESRFAGSALLHDHNIVSGISVIIHGQDAPFGVLEAFTGKKRMFKTEDINFTQAVANLLANAARNQLDKRKDEFLGIASHELKTPLTSMKTFIQMLEKHETEKKDARALLFLAKTEGQINKLTDLIADLLDISRINSGKLEFHDERFSFAELIREIVSEQQLVTKKHTIYLENEVKKNIFADRYRISQVMTNLLSNAIKYSPDSDKIIIRATQTEEMLTVSVRDFGVGIPKSEQKDIFDRFYQGNGMKRLDFPGGLGLGLYISQEIVKRYHGQIWVESTEGKGAEFTFRIPFRWQSMQTDIEPFYT